jgi:hypothetical protein
MRIERLLAKLQFEVAEKDRRLEAIRRQTHQPPTKTKQSRNQLYQLRARTAEIEEDLKLRAEVEREQERFCKAKRALRIANLTASERKAQAEETRQFQIRLSRVISPEHHPNWRAHAQAEFLAKKL